MRKAVKEQVESKAAGCRQKEEMIMDKQNEIPAKRKALWLAEAFGIVLAYFGAFGVLMYPVLDAAGYLA